MAEFTTLITSGKIQTAYLQRQGTLEEISRNVLSIKDLDRVNLNSRTFNRLESFASKSLEELRLANRELDVLLMKANPNVIDDKSYKSDQKMVRERQFSLLDEIDKYTQLLHSKSIPYPPDVKPETSSGDLAASLSKLIESQNNLVESQNKKI